VGLDSSQRTGWHGRLPVIMLFTALHYLLLLILDSVVFLFAHFPPALLDLSPLVIGITYLQQFLNLPRILLRHIWFSEVTPGWLNLFLLIVNSLVFGALWFVWRRFRR
jgi:hypothetical protein